MPLLLLGARLYPTLNAGRVAGVLMEPPTGVVEAGPQHPNLTVDCGGREITRAAALMEARPTKPLAIKRMNLRTTTLTPMMEEAEDIQRRGNRERGSRGTPRRTD